MLPCFMKPSTFSFCDQYLQIEFALIFPQDSKCQEIKVKHFLESCLCFLTEAACNDTT